MNSYICKKHGALEKQDTIITCICRFCKIEWAKKYREKNQDKIKKYEKSRIDDRKQYFKDKNKLLSVINKTFSIKHRKKIKIYPAHKKEDIRFNKFLNRILK